MDLEGTMLSEMYQTVKENCEWSYLYVESKKPNSHKQNSWWLLEGSSEVKEMGEGAHRSRLPVKG